VPERVPEILFVCVGNAGRSQMAAAWAKHLAGERVSVRSAGSRPADRVSRTVVEVMREAGVDLAGAFPRKVTDEDVRTADVVITMGCGDSCPVHPGKRHLDWKVDDPRDEPPEVVRRIRDDVRARVETLLRELGSLGT
jgi:arsenate reductase (thioredoxin)